MSVLFTACAGPRAARELSRETLVQVVEYEEQLRNMSRELGAHYRKVIEDTKNDIPNFEQNSIRTHKYQLATDAVDQMVSKGFHDKDFREYVLEVVKRVKEERTRFANLLSKQILNQNSAIRKLKQDEKALKITRTKLEELQKEPSYKDRVTQIKPLLKHLIDNTSLQDLKLR